MASHAAGPEPATGAGHETRDIDVRPIAVAGVALAVVMVVAAVLVWVMLGYLKTYQARVSPPASPLAAEYGRKEPPEPRLQTLPIADLQSLHAAEDAALHGYGWVDRGTGAVRIPIARALELVAQRGLKGHAEAGSAAGAPAAGAQ